MRFKLHIDGAVAYAPIVELHFAQVHDYYLATDGFIDGELHLLGLGVKHTRVRIERTGLTFPTAPPANAFPD